MASTFLLAAWAFAGLGACATCLEKTQFLPDGWSQLKDAPDAANPLRMSIALGQPETHGLSATLTGAIHLSIDEIHSLRTPDQGDVDNVLRWLADNGITETKPEKDWVHVRTTVGKAEKLLNMELHRYSFEGKPPVLRTTEYSIPDSLSGVISFVHPIANFMTPTHEVAASRPMPPSMAKALRRRTDDSLCSAITMPHCIAKQYNISYSTPDGKSPVRFAIAGFLEQYANFEDVEEFFKRTKPNLAAAGYNFSVELVNGGENLQDLAKAGTEANLDVEYGMAIGYPAQVTYFSTGGRGVKLNDSGKPIPEEYADNEPYLELLEYLLDMPDHQLPHVMSMSYADDEISVPRPYADRVCAMFGMLTARGTSVLVSSGDGGAKGGRNATCRTNDGTNKDVTVATFPATCPWVTAVGAVTNTQNPPRGATFSSGGFSQYFQRERWQDEAVGGYVEALEGHLKGYYDPKMRATPDISAVGTQFMTIVSGQPIMLDGTSASAPVVAALIALVNDARLRKGKRVLGWLNEKLYSPKVRSVLYDTTGGQSLSCVFAGGSRPGGWPAKKGWDAITGLGTPGNFNDLLEALPNLHTTLRLPSMPTQHVEPQSEDHLGEVANALLKARKVVVITGAGISTNSGIPDFRSENGLYSLIQAQFDAAARQARQAEAAAGESDNDGGDEFRPCKRRKMSREDSIEPADSDLDEVGEEKGEAADTIYVQSELPKLIDEEPAEAQPNDGQSEQVDQPGFTTPRSKPAQMSTALLTTSPLSSPPAEDFIIPPSTFRPHTHKRLVGESLPLSSSPLSSPPPILFDPFILSSPSEASSGRRSSTSPSEVDDNTPSSNSLSSSQASSSGRNTLPNMKGRDLFDANIWSDPIRTSVFYTFATSLRQKIKEAEPTSSHRFISHLRDRGKLVRCYTQNIDQIEEKVGLSTCLQHGPGSRGRFSRRSTTNTAQLNKMVEEASAVSNESSSLDTPSQPEGQMDNEFSQLSQETPSDGTSSPATDGATPSTDLAKPLTQLQKRQVPRSGVECVFLHGSLELLRCFLCGRLCSWEDDEREAETLAGQQPECPHCVGATVAREEKGKRALGVGKLRPDIVLYGEEHPNSHLISPIVTHDLALYPDMLLILGTSLRVHGLKVMVREFAKAVHSKSGKVVFVNFTKPPESSWGDVIDYWVQWDCDAWVADLQSRIPKLWQDAEPPRPKKQRESSGTSEDKPKGERKRPPAANPVALRDTKVTGAYWTSKVLQELQRITGTTPPFRRASIPAGLPSTDEALSPLQKTSKPKPKRPRKSAPGALEKPKRTSSTLNPNHGRSKTQAGGVAQSLPALSPAARVEDKVAIGSILNSVKENPRIRKRKVIDGEEVPAPCVGRRRGGPQGYKPSAAELELPPLRSPPMQESTSPYGKPQPLEPQSPPSGPLSSLSPNLRSAKIFDGRNTCYTHDLLVRLLDSGPTWSTQWKGHEDVLPLQHGNKDVEASAAMTLAALRTSPILVRTATPPPQSRRNLEGQLMDWGSNWSCKR
ncbi:NAD-dependent histone deacetylase HST3 [Tolypocladium paradoxum]|uniref:tripeptidyl-peptidase II n=1 Tax=Tolypocladium paradoxum TaxID=94208 RepID=A0A2S4KNB9_9HYPO|nr:NAD-dependent histone deacetylase HST3 [Tolypocladium paradoxum]